MTALLRLENVSRSFGGLRALSDVTFTLNEREVVGLIGPNGAGKTTLVNVVTGVFRPGAGSVVFQGRSIGGMKPYRISRLGIARTFQVVQPFPRMTVLENVAAGALFAGAAPDVQAAREAAMEHLRFVGLGHQAGAVAGALTLAGRKRLELAKSLAMEPKLLLLDEVNAGLNTAEIEGALELIRSIAARGVTILLIEHVMRVVLSLCSRVAVLHHGELIAEGDPDEVVSDSRVIEAYLGKRFAERHAGGGPS